MNSIEIIASFMALLAVVAVVTADTRVMRITVKNETPYITTVSNQTKRRIKFLFDTGATNSFIAADLLNDDAFVYGESLETAFSNQDDGEVESYGLVDIVLPRLFDSFQLAVNVMDRNIIGGEDGVFGFNLMQTFEMIIDIPEGQIEYTVKEKQGTVHDDGGQSQAKLQKQLSRQSSRKLLKTLSRKLTKYYSFSDSEK